MLGRGWACCVFSPCVAGPSQGGMGKRQGGVSVGWHLGQAGGGRLPMGHSHPAFRQGHQCSVVTSAWRTRSCPGPAVVLVPSPQVGLSSSSPPSAPGRAAAACLGSLRSGYFLHTELVHRTSRQSWWVPQAGGAVAGQLALGLPPHSGSSLPPQLQRKVTFLGEGTEDCPLWLPQAGRCQAGRVKQTQAQ